MCGIAISWPEARIWTDTSAQGIHSAQACRWFRDQAHCWAWCPRIGAEAHESVRERAPRIGRSGANGRGFNRAFELGGKLRKALEQLQVVTENMACGVTRM